MAQIINLTDMNVIFENVIFDIDDKIRAVVLDLINRILPTRNETELRATVADCARSTDLDRYFVYGYGSHHFWVKQRKFSDPTKIFEQRRIIVKF